MGCDFYVFTSLEVWYVTDSGIDNSITFSYSTERGWMPDTPDGNDSDVEVSVQEYMQKFNKPPKKLYENDEWIRPEYAQKYENFIKDQIRQKISDLIEQINTIRRDYEYVPAKPPTVSFEERTQLYYKEIAELEGLTIVRIYKLTTTQERN